MSFTTENQCPNCGSELQAVQNLDSNGFVQNEHVQYDCIVCSYRYNYENLLMQNDEMSYDKSLYCPTCDKSFAQPNSLKRHMIAHNGERPFCCDACDKSFKTKAALKRHSIIHTGECPYECSTCKRRFNQISNLRKHLLIHSNNCPYYCNSCGKGFNQLSNLKKHSVVHEGNRQEKASHSKKPDHSVIPKGLEKSVARPVLTFVRPADS